MGTTLFFALTGEVPFVLNGTLPEIVRVRQSQKPLRAGSLSEDIPPALDAVLDRMMALDPADRYATPQAVMHALLPFVHAAMPARPTRSPIAQRPARHAWGAGGADAGRCVLVITHDAERRRELMNTLAGGGFDCHSADSMEKGLRFLREGAAEAVLLDADWPAEGGRHMLKMLLATSRRAETSKCS